MKRKIKKILRLFLVFLSSFAIVLCWLPTKAMANEYDGNSYAYPFTHTVDSVKLWACYLYQKLEEQGYYVTSKIEDFSDEVKEVCLEYGIDVYNAAGEYIDNGIEYVNTITGLVIDYSNPYIQEFIEGSKNWEITDKASDIWDFYYNIYKKFFSFSDTLTIDAYFENPNAFSASGRENINKYFSFKNFGLSRGNYNSISGSEISSNNWGVPVNIFIRPHLYFDYDGNGSWFTGMANLTSPTYVNTTSVSYSGSPYDIYGYDGSMSYYNGLVTLHGTITDNTGFNIDHDMVRFDVKLEGLYDQGQVALTSDYKGTTFFTPISNCSIDDQGLITPTSPNNDIIEFYVHCNSAALCSFKIWTYNFSNGGVTAPDLPIYSMPDPTDPNYETERKNYDYFTTETDRILDEYDIDSFMNDIRNTFDDTPWLFYPIEFYNEVATVLTDNYSDTFDFTLEEMDFSIIADGFVIPHKEFHFDPDELPNTVKALLIIYNLLSNYLHNQYVYYQNQNEVLKTCPN